MSVTVTDQDKKLLDLIAKGEAIRGNDPYTSLWPSTREPALIQMTLAEVDRFQTNRINSGYSSSAVGRYQFIRKTLREAVGILGVDPLTVRFTPKVQDALILGILKAYRKYNEWLSGRFSTDKFMVKLAQEFASMPVPYSLRGANRQVSKGQSYYAGDSLNRANHDPDSVYLELEDILNGGQGGSTSIDTSPQGDSGAYSAKGKSEKTVTLNEAAGAGAGPYTGGNAGSRPIPDYNLDKPSDVYIYKKIDPLDDRYDFRTGEKVKDMSIHGTGAASKSPVSNSNVGPSNSSVPNAGSEITNDTGPVGIFKDTNAGENPSETFNSDLLGQLLTGGKPSAGDLVIPELFEKPSSESDDAAQESETEERQTVESLGILNRTTSNKQFPQR